MNIDEMQAGRELDALVAERVMGWKNVSFDEVGDEWTGARPANLGYHEVVPHHSTDIGIAMQQVVPRIHQLKTAAFSLDCLSPTDDYWQATFKSGLDMKQAKFDRLDCAVADTPELAICKAALRAMATV